MKVVRQPEISIDLEDPHDYINISTACGEVHIQVNHSSVMVSTDQLTQIIEALETINMEIN